MKWLHEFQTKALEPQLVTFPDHGGGATDMLIISRKRWKIPAQQMGEQLARLVGLP